MKNRKNIIIALALVFAGILLGWLIKPSNNQTAESLNHQHVESSENQEWTCSMHPQIRQNESGDCPICGMNLIPVGSSGAGNDLESYHMSENAMKLANVQTMTVGRGDASREMRLNGKVQVDERNSYSQSTHIPGRIEQLSINFTGESVKRGQTLATVYSSELVTAQAELLQAASIKESQPELFEAAKQKLRNWKIGEAQIQQILSGGKALERFTIRADVNGIVTEKMVDLGDYVERGMPIYEISDLSKVWVLFDLYEGQLAAVKEGDKIEFTINSFPGEIFEGIISFVDPLLNSQTRVATARVEVDNEDGRLKPGMFASGIVANSIGSSNSEELVIPKSAVLWTGKRSIVYVKEEINEGAGFKLREITLGTSLGDSYVVEEGLKPGEEIVSNGAFTVDAAVQLSGRASMMNPDVGENETSRTLKYEIPEVAREEFSKITNNYLRLKDALVEDDFDTAKKEIIALEETVKNIQTSGIDTDVATVWKSYETELNSDINNILNSGEISEIRDLFDELSTTIIGLVKTFQLNNETLYVQRCPMANNDNGASWLSKSSEIKNPYYGSAMLSCGEVTHVLE